MAMGGVVLGALWGALPGVLRALLRADETVVTLLLNYVAGLLLLHLIHGPWRDPEGMGWPQGVALPEFARLGGVFETNVHGMVVVALLVCLALGLAAKFMVAGYEARVIAANPKTASYSKMRVRLYYVLSFCLAGAVAGIAGFGELAGVQGRLREGMSLGYGYAGFFVAWLCGNRFAMLPVGSFLFALIITGADALQVRSGLPFATVYLLQGVVFLVVLWRNATRDGRRKRPAGGGG